VHSRAGRPSTLITVLFLSWLSSVLPASAQTAAINGPLRIQTDVPAVAATVLVPFAVGGWAIDQIASSGTGIDAVHVWAIPETGAPIFLGVATEGVSRPDVAAAFGAQFLPSGFNLTAAAPLTPGTYTLAVFGHRASTGAFDIVDQRPITVRGITLSDLFPCAAGQGPQFNGTTWGCAANPGAQGPVGPQGPAGPTGPTGPTGSTTPVRRSGTRATRSGACRSTWTWRAV